jgi:tRNA modification GTPase
MNSSANHFYLDDQRNIIACATGNLQNSALAVIRISGTFSIEVFQPFFKKINLNNVIPNKTYNTGLFNKDEVKVDDVVITFYQAPKSYNGENILEISTHGNQLLIQRILELFIESGLVRLSLPGEFTFRALKNKKITLSQAEGLDLLLNGRSLNVIDQGLSLLKGEFKDFYQELHSSFLQLQMAIEMKIDFAEDIGEEASQHLFENSLERFTNQIEILYSKVHSQIDLIKEPGIILMGPVNSGKSSLFNAMLGSNRAIVSSIPGTTRDYICETISFKQVRLNLFDTAGFRSTLDEIEAEGILRGFELAKKTFFKILVINPFNYLLNKKSSTFQLEDYLKNEIDLIVITHSDLDGFSDSYDKFSKTIKDTGNAKIPPIFVISLGKDSNKLTKDFGPIGPGLKNENFKFSGPIGPENSSLNQKNELGPIGPRDNEILFEIADLNLIFERILKKYLKMLENDPILVERQCESIKKVYFEWKLWFELWQIEKIKPQQDWGLVSHQLTNTRNCLFELIGVVTSENVLDSVFRNFCIGK